MKRIILIACIVLTANLSKSQVNWEWVRKVPQGYFRNNIKIADDKLGNIYIGGQIDSSYYSVPVSSIFHYNSNGDLLTQYYFPKNFTFQDIDINQINQLIISGYFSDTLNISGKTFISTGGTDIFIGTFDTNLTCVSAKTFGGKSFDRALALVFDNNNNYYLSGILSDTIDIGGNLIKCEKSGNSFLSKFNSFSELLWLKIDSTDKEVISSPAYPTDLQINNNNELLLKGRLDEDKKYFSFCGYSTALTGDIYGYDLEFRYAIKLNEDGVAIWGKCFRQEKWSTYDIIGLNTTTAIGISGDVFCANKLTILNKDGLAYKTIKMDEVKKGICMIQFIGTIDDQIYLLASEYWYNNDPERKRLPSFICKLVNDEIVILDSIKGQQVGKNSLFKNSTGKFVLGGIFNEVLLVGIDSLKSDLNQYNDYIDNPFLLAFTLNSSLAITSSDNNPNDLNIYPNPTTNNFTIRANSNAYKEDNYKIKIMDALGREFYSKEINNFPEQGLNVDLKNVSKGIYFVDILFGEERAIKKLAID